ncbi:DUF4129 domain-containing protein [Cellulomonas biazotea]|uniref:Protein-glutamine gamma-glutamyltransferase-like C-terminal domain-containing protein n=1 Tax=Cellulomonas biazotea TaxID=1709 RepID=A0A402DT35_9CELL|nr:DUF4129 domain-containing protein [Cellulomonas biazotea]GCE77320.1 hypothetical protein CBZ_23760 [Cellulomonas biazotea]
MPSSRPPAAVLGVAALAVVAVLGAAVAGPWQVTGRATGWAGLPVPSIPPAPPPPRPDPPPPDGVATATGLPAWWVVLLGVLVALLVALLVVVGRRLLRSVWAARQAPADEGLPAGLVLGGDAQDVTRALHEASRAAGRRLAEDLPPNDAVVAAWVALERAAAGSGLTRDPSQTATELTVAVLDATPADPAATRTLLRLYLTARFSEHPVTADDVAAARASLRAIEDALAGATAVRS